jgi:hypothetical protein
VLDSGDNCCRDLGAEGIAAGTACCTPDAMKLEKVFESRAASRAEGGFEDDESGGEGKREEPSDTGCFWSMTVSAGSQGRFDGVALGADER